MIGETNISAYCIQEADVSMVVAHAASYLDRCHPKKKEWMGEGVRGKRMLNSGRGPAPHLEKTAEPTQEA